MFVGSSRASAVSNPFFSGADRVREAADSLVSSVSRSGASTSFKIISPRKRER